MLSRGGTWPALFIAVFLEPRRMHKVLNKHLISISWLSTYPGQTSLILMAQFPNHPGHSLGDPHLMQSKLLLSVLFCSE